VALDAVALWALERGPPLTPEPAHSGRPSRSDWEEGRSDWEEGSVESPLADLAIRLAGPADAGQLARAMGLTSAAPVLGRLATGRMAYVAERNGEVVSYGWVSTGPEAIGEVGSQIAPARGEAYVWDCATLPAYRGRGYYPALLRRIAADLFARGIHRVWICASVTNRPSLRGFARAGFRPVGTLQRARGLGRRRTILTPTSGASRATVVAGRVALGLAALPVEPEPAEGRREAA